MRRLSWPVLLALPLLAAGGLFGAAGVSRRTPDLGLIGGSLRPCPSTPNCVTSDAADADVAPLAFAGDAHDAFETSLALLRARSDVDLVTVEEGYAHAVFESALFGFRDDLELRLDAAAGVVHVRSASRVGYSDLGANRRRVEALRAGLAAAHEPAAAPR